MLDGESGVGIVYLRNAAGFIPETSRMETPAAGPRRRERRGGRDDVERAKANEPAKPARRETQWQARKARNRDHLAEIETTGIDAHSRSNGATGARE